MNGISHMNAQEWSWNRPVKGPIVECDTVSHLSDDFLGSDIDLNHAAARITNGFWHVGGISGDIGHPLKITEFLEEMKYILDRQHRRRTGPEGAEGGGDGQFCRYAVGDIKRNGNPNEHGRKRQGYLPRMKLAQH